MNQAQNNKQNKIRENRPIFNRSREIIGYEIPDRMTSANVPDRVFLTTEVIDHLGGKDQENFFAVRDMQRSGFLPRLGSASKPLTMRDLELYNRNSSLGYRHWRWIQKSGQCVKECTGYDFVNGYGYETETGFVIVDSDDSKKFEVWSW